MKSRPLPTPKMEYSPHNRELVSMLNASAVEIAQSTRLPLGCIYLSHPSLPGFGVKDEIIRAPILLVVSDRAGKFFWANSPDPVSLEDMVGPSSNHIIPSLAQWFFDNAKDYSRFMERGGFAVRTISVKAAQKLPLVSVHEDNRVEIRKVLSEDWQGWSNLSRPAEGFEAIHDYIDHYSSGNCWYYAEALRDQLGDEATTVAFHLESSGQAKLAYSGYHACVKTADGLYHDIWGAHSLDEMQRRLVVKISKEESMWGLLNRIDPSLDKLKFKELTDRAAEVVKMNPAHQSLAHTPGKRKPFP